MGNFSYEAFYYFVYSPYGKMERPVIFSKPPVLVMEIYIFFLCYFKAPGGYMAINMFIRQNSGFGVTFKNFVSWKCIRIAFHKMDRDLRQCCKLLKLISLKTWFLVQVFSSRRTQSNLIAPLSDQVDPLVRHT